MVKKDSGEKRRKNTDDIDRQYLSLKEYNPPVVDYSN